MFLNCSQLNDTPSSISPRKSNGWILTSTSTLSYPFPWCTSPLIDVLSNNNRDNIIESRSVEKICYAFNVRLMSYQDRANGHLNPFPSHLIQLLVILFQLTVASLWKKRGKKKNLLSHHTNSLDAGRTQFFNFFDCYQFVCT